MHHLRTLLLSLLLAVPALAGDSPYNAVLSPTKDLWDGNDLVWFISDSWEPPGTTPYMWLLRDPLLQTSGQLAKWEHSGAWNPVETVDFIENSVLPREPSIVVLCLGNCSPACDKPEKIQTADAFGKALLDAINLLHAVGAEIIVLGPSPISDTPEAKNPANDASAKYADIAASTAKANDATYIDMRAACLDYLKANPPAADKIVLVGKERQFSQAWHTLAAGLVAKAIAERLTAAPTQARITDKSFVESLTVELPLRRVRKGADIEIRYTLDGKDPAKGGKKYDKPFTVTSNTVLNVVVTDKANNYTSSTKATFTKVKAKLAESMSRRAPGLEWGLFFGKWPNLPDFSALKPDATGTWYGPEFEAFQQVPAYRDKSEALGLRFVGYIDIPVEGVYRLSTASDEGSRIWIDEDLVVDNDGFHGTRERGAKVGLREGVHRVRIDYSNMVGGHSLDVYWQSDGIRRSKVPDNAWIHNPGKPWDWKPVEKKADKPADKKK